MFNNPRPRPYAGTAPGRVSMKFDTTNGEFAQKDTNFMSSCESAGVKATARQASKFRNKRGKAYRIKIAKAA